MDELPEPLTPPFCDLRDFPRMMIDIPRLFGSSFNALGSRNALAWMIGHKLWYRAWHQVPAASLPDDDDQLCHLAELGFDRKAFSRAKDIGLRGWIRCSDGRLYHPVVAEAALEAWKRKLEQRWRTECARIKKANQRDATAIPRPEFDQFVASLGLSLAPGWTPAVPASVPEPSPDSPPVCPQGQTQGNGIQGTGTGTGILKEEASPLLPAGAGEAGARSEPWSADPNFQLAWDAYPASGKANRSSRPKSWPEWRRVTKQIGSDRLLAAVRAFVADEPWLKVDGGAKSFHLWLKDARWEHWLDSGDGGAWTDQHWQIALRRFAERDEWPAPIGPKPGEPGCRVPPHLLPSDNVIPLRREA